MMLNKGEYISHGNFQGSMNVVNGRVGITNMDRCGLSLFTKSVRGKKIDFINLLVRSLDSCSESFYAVFFDHSSNKLYLLSTSMPNSNLGMSRYDLVNEEVLLADRLCSDVTQLHDYFFEIGDVVSRQSM